MSSIVAIVGRPNVGNYTFFNRLIQKRDGIVDSQSGVTRDRHYGYSFWNGKEFTVIYTGGFMLGGEDNFEKEIDKYGSELYYITGLDTLLANPRPPISDMHNWDSIIINMISKRLTRSNFSSPVIMPMSNQSYKAICQRFSLFEKNHIVLKCRNPGRVEMKAYVTKNLKEDGYNLNRFVMEKLNHTISKVFDNQEHRNVDYLDICWSLIDKIIEKQTRRLMETDHENLTKSRLKNITLVDIPKYVSIAEGQAIFF